jgi:hypothetical protein
MHVRRTAAGCLYGSVLDVSDEVRAEVADFIRRTTN